MAIAAVAALGLPSIAPTDLGPGTGSYALQLLLAALLASVYILWCLRAGGLPRVGTQRRLSLHKRREVP
jgi:hypothetical protein